MRKKKTTEPAKESQPVVKLDVAAFSKLSAQRADTGFKTYRNVPITYWTTALAGEVGELCNMVKKMERVAHGGIDGGSSYTAASLSKADLAEEVGGIFIYLALLSGLLEVDFEEAIIDTFNSKSDKYGFPEKYPAISSPPSVKPDRDVLGVCGECKNLRTEPLSSDEAGAPGMSVRCAKGHWEGLGNPEDMPPPDDPWENCRDRTPTASPTPPTVQQEDRRRGLKAFDDSMRDTLGQLIEDNPFSSVTDDQPSPTALEDNNMRQSIDSSFAGNVSLHSENTHGSTESVQITSLQSQLSALRNEFDERLKLQIQLEAQLATIRQEKESYVKHLWEMKTEAFKNVSLFKDADTDDEISELRYWYGKQCAYEEAISKYTPQTPTK